MCATCYITWLIHIQVTEIYDYQRRCLINYIQKFVCEPEIVRIGKGNSPKGGYSQHFIL